MQLVLIDWKPFQKNTLKGFATIRLGKSMKIRDVGVHEKDGKRWASLPSKPMIGGDGTAIRDDSGKIKYVAIVEWMNREAGDDFSQSVVDAIEAAHPGDTTATSA